MRFLPSPGQLALSAVCCRLRGIDQKPADFDFFDRHNQKSSYPIAVSVIGLAVVTDMFHIPSTIHIFGARRLSLRLCAVVVATLANIAPCHAAERGLSHYLAGYYGDFGVAIAPRPGLYVYATSYNYKADQGIPSSSGRISLEASAFIYGFQKVTTEKFLGASLAFGAYSAYISADLGISLSGPAGTVKSNAHSEGQADTSVSPVILYWNSGNWHWSLYEAIFIPTGKFDSRSSLNLGRNYFSFDTVFATTWLDQNAGIEVSLVQGLMVNTENSDTNYKTGSELHIDGMLNLFVSPRFAVGVQGYVYTQIETDSGFGVSDAGARSYSVGAGPSFMWLPTELGIEGKVVGKWLHDLDAENRFRGDVLSLTGVVLF